MSRFLVALLVSSLVGFLPACSFRLVEVKYVPPAPQPRSTPPKPATQPGEEEPSLVELLTIQSKEETTNGTKSLLLNGNINPAFASAHGLGADNCIQAVTISTGEVLADFADLPCPTGGVLLPADRIKFSLYFDTSTLELYIDTVSSLGSATINPNPANPSATLDELCSGPYAGNCTLVLENASFKAIELP